MAQVGKISISNKVLRISQIISRNLVQALTINNSFIFQEYSTFYFLPNNTIRPTKFRLVYSFKPLLLVRVYRFHRDHFYFPSNRAFSLPFAFKWQSINALVDHYILWPLSNVFVEVSFGRRTQRQGDTNRKFKLTVERMQTQCASRDGYFCDVNLCS